MLILILILILILAVVSRSVAWQIEIIRRDGLILLLKLLLLLELLELDLLLHLHLLELEVQREGQLIRVDSYKTRTELWQVTTNYNSNQISGVTQTSEGKRGYLIQARKGRRS